MFLFTIQTDETLKYTQTHKSLINSPLRRGSTSNWWYKSEEKEQWTVWVS